MHHDKTEDVVKVNCLDAEFMGQCTHQSTSQVRDPETFSTIWAQEQKERRNHQEIKSTGVGMVDSWTIFKIIYKVSVANNKKHRPHCYQLTSL